MTGEYIRSQIRTTPSSSVAAPHVFRKNVVGMGNSSTRAWARRGPMGADLRRGADGVQAGVSWGERDEASERSRGAGLSTGPRKASVALAVELAPVRGRYAQEGPGHVPYPAVV